VSACLQLWHDVLARSPYAGYEWFNPLSQSVRAIA
jgi:hypothetical protein